MRKRTGWIVGGASLLFLAWAPPVSTGQIQDPLDTFIHNAARKHDLDPLLLKAIISVESNFDPDSLSRAGACGLMQLMPETAKLFGVRDIFDPEENIEIGAHHFRNMMVRYSYNLPLSLAAYNAGVVPVALYQGIPPYKETQGYVRQVLARYHASQLNL